MLYYIILCYIILYYIVLYYIILYYIILYYIILYNIILYYIILYYIILYYIILYCIKLYYMILYYMILYYILYFIITYIICGDIGGYWIWLSWAPGQGASSRGYTLQGLEGSRSCWRLYLSFLDGRALVEVPGTLLVARYRFSISVVLPKERFCRTLFSKASEVV